jgi:hypothetical protein
LKIFPFLVFLSPFPIVNFLWGKCRKKSAFQNQLPG